MTTNKATSRLRVLSQYFTQDGNSTSAAKPFIHLSKSAVLIDEKVQILVKGLAKHQKVTLHSSLKDPGKFHAACGHYIANDQGEVNTFQHPSHGGTFEGVEDMGLFWSMKSQHTDKQKRIMKEDVMTPFNVKIAVHDGFLSFEDLPASEHFHCLSSCHLQRHYVIPGVQRIPVREKGIYGTLFLPPGKGPFPAVIDVMGLTGGIMEIRSPLLASHGFASFILAYVNFEDLPKSEADFDFNYFLRAFDWLAAHPSVDPKAMGAISTCIGGAFAGLIAMKRSAMKCLVSINNSYAPVGVNQKLEDEDIQAHTFNFERMTQTPLGIKLRSLYREEDEFRCCPIWRNGIKVLQIHGLDDDSVHPEVGRKFKALIPDKFKKNFTLIEYPGAGHMIEPPYMPICAFSYNQILKKYFCWGGEPKAHAAASEDCWQKALNFLGTHLQTGTKSHIICQNVLY